MATIYNDDIALIEAKVADHYGVKLKLHIGQMAFAQINAAALVV